MHRIISGLLFILLSLGLQAQKSQKWLLTPSAGWGHYTARDQARSPLLYQGSTFLGFTGFETRKKNRWHRYEATFFAGRLEALSKKPDITPRTSLLRLNVDGRILFDIRPETEFPIHWHIGWGVMNTGAWRQNLRYSNNTHGYEWASSLSLEGYASWEKKWSKGTLQAGAGLRLPIVSAVVYPVYNSVYIRGSLETSNMVHAVWKSLKIVMPPQFVRLSTECQATYFLPNGNGLRLSYTWDFYQLNTQTPTVAAQHAIFFSTLFRL